MQLVAVCFWKRRWAALPGVLLMSSVLAAPVDFQGVASVGTAGAGIRSDRFTAGFDKSPFGLERPAARLTLRGDVAWLDGQLLAAVIIDANSQRSGLLDLHEAWLAWTPVPASPWRYRARLGAFFPHTSLETGYEQIGWNAARTISGSAINSWIGEEIRILGGEFSAQWRGALAGWPHQFGVRAGAFGWNDPAGTEMAWRGWNLGGRVTGLFRNLRLPDLAVIRPGAPIEAQSRDVHLFRELDNRPGFYGAVEYGYDGVLDLQAMRYDNRGDPLRLVDGQYSWRTRFDHASLRVQLPAGVELLAQAMQGDTFMGPRAVYVDFTAWYLLASRRLGPGQATIRHDWFEAEEDDIMPADANGDRGHAWAFAYSVPLPHSLSLVAEWLRVKSDRPARAELGEEADRTESSLALELRWSF